MAGDVQGWGTLGTVVFALLGALLVAWTVGSLRIQFTLGKFVIFFVAAFILGMFVEAYLVDAREQLLLGVSLALMFVAWAGYLLWRAGRKIGRTVHPAGRR